MALDYRCAEHPGPRVVRVGLNVFDGAEGELARPWSEPSEALLPDVDGVQRLLARCAVCSRYAAPPPSVAELAVMLGAIEPAARGGHARDVLF